MIKHYLLTIEASSYYVHGYVITDDYRAVDATMNKMADVAEQHGGIVMPIVLCTTLADGVGKVQALLSELDPKIAKAIQTATDCHQTIVGVPKEDPVNAPLMALH